MTPVDDPITHRRATVADSALLAELNKHLIDDEGNRNPMTLSELETGMRGWLEGEYAATLFERDGGVVAYAIWRHEQESIYLHQFSWRGRPGAKGLAGRRSNSSKTRFGHQASASGSRCWTEISGGWRSGVRLDSGITA